ncbi:FeoB-associated Cys-rich membrane protein [Paenibacillus farraposensis]|uniref:FeoB-associated Cys-rich membrane protein n=3 Tax=Bacilli TaxID=91061 RepID=A0ABW4DKH3_9BACL|nr:MULTISPECIES: FeoB-associated Cys-rich membrane protein [Lacticaseibacillus]
MATFIIAALLIALIGVVGYNQFFNKKKKAAGCSKCADAGCPLFDQAQMMKQNSQKKA